MAAGHQGRPQAALARAAWPRRGCSNIRCRRTTHLLNASVKITKPLSFNAKKMRPKMVISKICKNRINLKTPIYIWASEFFRYDHPGPRGASSKLTPRGHFAAFFGPKVAKNGPIWSIRNLAWLPMHRQAQRTFRSSNRSPNKNFGFFGWGGVHPCYVTHF